MKGDALRQVLRSLIRQEVPIQTLWGNVKSVDWDKKTCTVTVDELDYFNVLLSIDGSEFDVKKPKTDTKVLIGIIANSKSLAFVLYVEEYEEWHLNGDKNGGLVNWPDAVKQLDKITARVDRLENALKGGAPATGAPDSGAALIASIKATLSLVPAPKEKWSNLEDKTILH